MAFIYIISILVLVIIISAYASSKKKEENNNTEQDACKRVDIVEFLDKYSTGASIPETLFAELNKKLLDGETYANIPTRLILQAEQNLEQFQKGDKALFDCVNRNNNGIELEKSGDIDKAISIYEENIAGDCYPATHSFDRLMILYRKRKDYDNEIRVIEKAIIVFSEVNRQRAEKAIKENPRKRKEIENALITNENVLGYKLQASNGKYLYCFCPYNVNKYKDRLIKAKELKTRLNQK